MNLKGIIFCLGLCFICPFLHAQALKITGIVSEDSTDKLIEGATVFLNSTSYGTVTDSKGNFELDRLQEGIYTLIISSIGYETYTEIISLNVAEKPFVVHLKEKANQLGDVVIQSYETDGWFKYGQFFLDNFIGTSALAKNCTLKNKDAVKFQFSTKKNELVAFADEPLVIENKALGYVIHYQMEKFSYNYDSKYLFYTGYPLFSEMKGNERQMQHWKEERKEVYAFSIMRFMRALFDDKLLETGYVVFRLKIKVPNVDKQILEAKEKLFYDTFPRKSNRRNIYATTLSPDALAYYKKVMHEPDTIDVTSHIPLTADSIAYAENDAKAVLSFPDYLIINNVFKKPPAEYLQQNADAKDSLSSVIHLPFNRPVFVSANGSYYNVQDLFCEGFWAWWQRLATLLPFDYDPSI